jgi:ribosomal protein S18 acetylase RimI-like enzyme
MTNEADRRAPELEVLRGGSGLVCRVRPWPSQPAVAQLVMYQQSRMPSVADLDRWCAELHDSGYTAARTTALATVPGSRVSSAGFTSIQELVLLQHLHPSDAPPPSGATRRMTPAHHEAAAAVDVAAFGQQWSLDADAIGDVRMATPRWRARLAGDGSVQAYAITGRDSRQGFLQRLAVAPQVQRTGLGVRLVLDSLRWCARWRVDKVLVNTHVGNDAALALYEHVGFERLTERLHVYERVFA